MLIKVEACAQTNQCAGYMPAVVSAGFRVAQGAKRMGHHRREEGVQDISTGLRSKATVVHESR